MLDRVLQNPVGANQYTREGFDNIKALAPTGTGKQQALRKLRKEAEAGNAATTLLRRLICVRKTWRRDSQPGAVNGTGGPNYFSGNS